MNENLPKEIDCKRDGIALDEITPIAFDYARRKRIIDIPFQRYYALKEEWEKYPDEWEDNILGMLAAAALFGSVKRTARFIRSIKAELSDTHVSMIRRWRKHPWFYCVFTVLKEYDKNFLEIQPLGDPPGNWPDSQFPKSLFLYSASTADSYRQGKNLFIALLWEGEHAFYTYGVILGFNGISEKDMYFFADIVNHNDQSPLSEPLIGINSRTTNLSDIILSRPLPFLRLFNWTQVPIMQSRAGKLEKSVSMSILPSLDLVKDVKTLRQLFEKAGEKVEQIVFEEDAAAITLGAGSPLYDPSIYISFTDRRIFLFALTEEAYLHGWRAINSFCSFPENPQVCAALSISTAAEEILDCEDELHQLQDLFMDSFKGPESLGLEEHDQRIDRDLLTMEQLQSVINRLTENYNEGTEEDDDSVAKSLGVFPEKVTELREQIFSTINLSHSEGADRFGLSPRAFHQLSIGGIPAAKGVLVVRNLKEIHKRIAALEIEEEKLFSLSPIFIFSKWLLTKAVGSGFIPATQAGFVGTAVVKAAFEDKVIQTSAERIVTSKISGSTLSKETLERLRPKKEADWPDFIFMRKLLEKARLLVFDGKRFLPGKNVNKFLADPSSLYYQLLTVMFNEYDWDYSPRFGTLPYVRLMAGFLFYAIGSLSVSYETKGEKDTGWFDSELLVESFIAAVPPLASSAKEEENISKGNIGIRDVVRIGLLSGFLHDFAVNSGLVEISFSDFSHSSIKPTALYAVIFGK